MASVSQRVSVAKVTEDDIVGHDGTLESAMRLWTAQYGPVTYNDWQSVYFALTKPSWPETLIEEIPAGETPPQKQVRMKEMYKTIQSEVHEPTTCRSFASAWRRSRDKLQFQDVKLV
jgi:hypothetical protein